MAQWQLRRTTSDFEILRIMTIHEKYNVTFCSDKNMIREDFIEGTCFVSSMLMGLKKCIVFEK